MLINVQGKLLNDIDTWKQYNILFTINPPIRINNDGSIPDDCTVWYDGCNTCQVNQGVLGACTRIMCFREDNPYCISNQSGH